MSLYLAPEPSLELIRYLRSANGKEGLGGVPVRKKSLDDAANSQRAIDELDATAHRWLDHVGRPIQTFIADSGRGTRTKSLVTRVFSQPVPSGAFLDIGHDVRICTPQFAFTQIAGSVDFVDAVAIGMELCGTYSQWRMAPGQMGDAYYLEHAESQSCTYGLPTAMTMRRVSALVDRLEGRRGIQAARSVLGWVADNSASPMETAIYLLLCLPKRLGGYGLPKPTFNPKLIIRNPDGTKERYPDLFWSDANIDVEYNSDSKHSGEWSRYRDSKREIELTVANVKVLPLTRPQVMNAGEFDAFAQGLRRMLGIRSRGTDLSWEFRCDDLRRKVFAGWH